MRIKRFNENQHYLTDPLDPEKKLEFKLDFNDTVNNLEDDLKLLAKSLGLNYNMKRGTDNLPEYFFEKDGLINHYVWYEETEPFALSIALTEVNDIEDIKTFEDLKQHLINYFNL